MIDDVANPETNGTRRQLVLSMVVAGVVVAFARWAFSADRRVYHISPDEPSQLAIARWLAGGRRWNMFDHATWQPGLGTLLTPIYWFTDDGETVVRWALSVNAVIGGLSAAVLVVLTRRLTGTPAPLAAVLAVLAAAAPSSLSASSFIWAEPLVSLTFLLTVLALLHWFDTGRSAFAMAAIAASIAGYSSHSRLLPLVGTTVLLTVGVEAWRRNWTRFVQLGMTAGLLLIASAAWTRWILANVWDDPSDQNTVGAVWRRAQHPLAIADSLVGQIWYQLAATLGIAGFGALLIARAAIGRSPREAPGSTDARVLAVSTAPLLLLSVIFMSDRPRPDQFIYGRYNDAVMWPIIVIGLAWVARRVRHGVSRPQSATVFVVIASTVASGYLIDRLHGDAIRESYGVRSMIAGLLAYVDGGDTLDVWRTSLVAAALLGAIIAVIALAHAPRVPDAAGRVVLGVGAVLAVAGLAVAVARTEHVADLRLNGWLVTEAVAEVDSLVPPGLPVAVRPVPNAQHPVVKWVPQRQRYLLYQLFLPERSFLRDRGVDDDVGPYVFAPLSDPELVNAGAEVIWRDPVSRIALWKEPEG